MAILDYLPTQSFGQISNNDNAIYVKSQSDFPTQDATSITLASDTPYIATASFTIDKKVLPADGSSFTARNIDGNIVTYLGTDPMFSGVDADFYIHDIGLDCPNTSPFDFSETTGGTKKFIATNVEVLRSNGYSDFSDLLLVQINNSNQSNPTKGIRLFGNITIVNIDRFAQITTDASFKGIDFGTSVITVLELSNLFFTGPVGSVGLYGLADGGNLAAGSRGSVRDCEFLGGITDLEGISVNDNEWFFSGNTPTLDTITQGFIDYNDATTVVTPITLVADTWTTLTNDGAGPFTNKDYKSPSADELIDTATGFFDFSDLDLGEAILIRNDFEVTPSTNNTLLELRYELGTGGGVYYLSTILGRLDSGSGQPYKFSLKPDYIYMGDGNTRDSPCKLQIRLSGNGTVVNNGSVVQVLGR